MANPAVYSDAVIQNPVRVGTIILGKVAVKDRNDPPNMKITITFLAKPNRRASSVLPVVADPV